jgi:hypothetical protein
MEPKLRRSNFILTYVLEYPNYFLTREARLRRDVKHSLGVSSSDKGFCELSRISSSPSSDSAEGGSVLIALSGIASISPSFEAA